MLLNLGLTADAAAAHENDSVESHREPHHSNPRPNSSIVSFATSPLLGLGSLYNRYKSPESPRPPQNKRISDMSARNVESLPSSDGESSLVESLPGPSQLRHSSSTKKQSSRPRTSYQLAHPAAHARHKRLKLRPKLLLQLQQASHTPRPLPILDVLPSTVYLPKLARKFPTMFRGKNGLGPNDLIIAKSELYQRALEDPNTRRDSGHESDEHQEVVATICQLLTEDALPKGKAEICFNDGPTWEATPLPNGSYEFVANTEHGPQTMRWVLRGCKSRRTSGIQSTTPADTKRFTFSMIDPNTRRHPVAASMTRNYLEVFDEYTIPGSKPPATDTSVISDTSQTDSPLEGSTFATDDRLRTLIVVTSIWVAFREGWSHTFSYNDTAATLTKTICAPTSKQDSTEADGLSGASHQNGVSNGSKGVGNSHTSPCERAKTTASGKLNKRSNSTSSAFLCRSGRSGAGGLNRHSMLSRAKDHDATQADQGGLNTQSTSGNRIEDSAAGPDDPSESKPYMQPAKQHTTIRGVEPETKPKRRHRLSNIFDHLIKRSGTH